MFAGGMLLDGSKVASAMMHAMPAQPNTLNASTLANFVDPLPIPPVAKAERNPGAGFLSRKQKLLIIVSLRNPSRSRFTAISSRPASGPSGLRFPARH